MRTTWRQLVSTRQRRYLTIGVSVYLLEVIVIVIAQKLGASSLVAVGWSFWLGLLTSFGLQKLITFQDTRLHHKVLLPQFLAFALLVAFNFGFTLLVTKLLSPLLPVVISRSMALGISTVWNYYLYKTRLFVSSEEPIVY